MSHCACTAETDSQGSVVDMFLYNVVDDAIASSTRKGMKAMEREKRLAKKLQHRCFVQIIAWGVEWPEGTEFQGWKI